MKRSLRVWVTLVVAAIGLIGAALCTQESGRAEQAKPIMRATPTLAPIQQIAARSPRLATPSSAAIMYVDAGRIHIRDLYTSSDYVIGHEFGDILGYTVVGRVDLYAEDAAANVIVDPGYTMIHGIRAPDGFRAVYLVARCEANRCSSQFQLWLADSRQGNRRLLLSSGNSPRPGFLFDPIGWSADGDVIYLDTSDPATESSFLGLWRLPLDESPIGQIDVGPGGYNSLPLISPDGRQLLLTGFNDDATGQTAPFGTPSNMIKVISLENDVASVVLSRADDQEYFLQGWVRSLDVPSIAAASQGADTIGIMGVPEASSGFQRPMTNYGSGYVWKQYAQYSCGWIYHPGWDYNGSGSCNDDLGTDILAVANGLVVYRNTANWGGMVVQHLYQGVTVYSQYGHIYPGLRAPGETVSKGEHIAELGNVGAPCAHLHWEIRESDHPDPANESWDCNILADAAKVDDYYEDPQWWVDTHGPYAATCSAPTNGTPRDSVTLNNRSVTFSWTPPNCPALDFYRFRVGTQANGGWFIDTTVGKDTTSTTRDIGSGYEKQTLYWAVWSHTPDGTEVMGGPWSFRVDTSVPPPPPTPVPGLWQVEYFRNKELNDRCATDGYNNAYVFKDWGDGAPLGGCNSDNWSARFTRRVHLYSGAYNFAIEADDWGRFYVNSDLVVNKWDGASQHYESRVLSEGDYDLRVEFADTMGGAKISAWWWGPGYDIPHDNRDSNQWYGHYWINPTQWWDSFARRNEGTGKLERTWNYDGPGWGMPSDGFSTRFERNVFFECGRYRFYLNHDDGAKLSIDATVRLDKWNEVGNHSVDVDLTRGYHEVQVDQYENGGAAYVGLDWSLLASCAPAAPVPVSPANGSSLPWDSDVTLSWNAASGATEYYAHLQGGPGISADWGWTSALLWHIGWLDPGSYTWTVKARNQYGDSPSSVTRAFSVNAAPADTVPPEVQWLKPVGEGEVYHVTSGSVLLEVSASDDVGVATVYFRRWDAVNEVFVELNSDVAPPYQATLDCSSLNWGWNEIIAWAFDGAGNSTWKFIWIYREDACASPGSPSLSAPADSSAIFDYTPTFTWGGVSEATSYQIQVDMGYIYPITVIDETTTSTSYTPSWNMSEGTYYWRVRGHNGSSGCDTFGAWSSYWEVSVAAQPYDPYTVWLGDFGTKAGGWTSQNQYPRLMGDVNGDGMDDIIGFGTHNVLVSLSQGNRFGDKQVWLARSFCAITGWTSLDVYPRFLADVNGDGKDDIIGFGYKNVFVALSNGAGFDAQQSWLDNSLCRIKGWSSQNNYPRMFGDLNGDGKEDIVGFGDRAICVVLSNGAGFGAQEVWLWDSLCRSKGWSSQNVYPRMLADVNGDGLADIVGFGDKAICMAPSLGTQLGAQQIWQWNGYCLITGWSTWDRYPRFLGDVDDDGRADVVGLGSQVIQGSLSTGTSFEDRAIWGVRSFCHMSGWSSQNVYPRFLADVTGDGRADLVGFGSNGVYVSPSQHTGASSSAVFGSVPDLPEAAGGVELSRDAPDASVGPEAPADESSNKGTLVLPMATRSAFSERRPDR